ncbi:uncharacterized protein NEMAJ01_0171 [Nematocida major]|uniref:uncharacterized protein n=1 Tax=Nematocida major TaxID=1912982 RepID=UPI0020084AD8|nr:uncharacterized protein NEMAJ01_0171 [Nematocida major]KAH9385275.1 hypothetical protein NEMAJ01_0171 [Nematocida major]
MKDEREDEENCNGSKSFIFKFKKMARAFKTALLCYSFESSSQEGAPTPQEGESLVEEAECRITQDVEVVPITEEAEPRKGLPVPAGYSEERAWHSLKDLDVQAIIGRSTVPDRVLQALKIAGGKNMPMQIMLDYRKREMLKHACSFLNEVREIIGRAAYKGNSLYTGCLIVFHLKKRYYTDDARINAFQALCMKDKSNETADSAKRLQDAAAESHVKSLMETTFLMNCAAVACKPFGDMYLELRAQIKEAIYSSGKQGSKTAKNLMLVCIVLAEVRSITMHILKNLMEGVCISQKEMEAIKSALPMCEAVAEEAVAKVEAASGLQKATPESASASASGSLLALPQALAPAPGPAPAPALEESLPIPKRKALFLSAPAESPKRREPDPSSISAKSEKKQPVSAASPVVANMSLIDDLRESYLFKKQRDIYMQARDFSNVENPCESFTRQYKVKPAVMTSIMTQHRLTFNLYELASKQKPSAKP